VWFITTYAIDYDTFVRDLFFEVMRRKSSKETSTVEAMVVGGRLHKEVKIRGVHQVISQKERRVRGNVCYVENQGI
jgi:hypothetical protein